MGNTAEAGNKTRKARACTFTVNTVKGKREFTPVNKRAKKLALIVGATLTVQNLRGIRKMGYRVLEYKGDKLVAIKLK